MNKHRDKKQKKNCCWERANDCFHLYLGKPESGLFEICFSEIEKQEKNK